MRTLDQELLAVAYAQVGAAVAALDENKDKEKAKKEKAKYKAAVKKAPALVQSCGLASAVAFFLSKDEPHFRRLLDDLAAMPGLKDVRTAAKDGTLDDYVFLTRRTQRALGFLKRMVDALMPDIKEDVGE